MTRPKIWKDTSFGGRPWCATNPYAPSVWRLCETWREAMEFVAEKSANPFPLELNRRYAEPLQVTYKSGWVFIDDRGDRATIMLAPCHWRPLARALTRLADKEGVA